MSDTLYIQTDKNMKVTKEIVTLGEIADLSCKNSFRARPQSGTKNRLAAKKGSTGGTSSR